MTKSEKYIKAWALALKNDFSLVNKIYHPDYKSFDFRASIFTNIDDDKIILLTKIYCIDNQNVSAYFETNILLIIFGPSKVNAE